MNAPGIIVGGLILYVWALKAGTNYVNAIDRKVKKLKLRAFPPGGTLSIELKNNNKAGITITNIEGSIIYQGVVISSFATTQPITLNPGQPITAEIDFSILITGFITTILNLVQGGGVGLNFTVTGNISAIGINNIPFSQVVGYELIN